MNLTTFLNASQHPRLPELPVPADMSQMTLERRQVSENPRPSLEEWQMPLVTHAALDRLGYVWHPGLQLLLCLPCGTAVSPRNIESHSVRSEGHEFVKKEDRAVIQSLCKLCSFGEREGRLPDVGPMGRLPRIQQFDIIQAVQCPICGRLYAYEDSAKRHYNDAHGSRVGQTFNRIDAQYLFKGQFGVMFAIEESTCLIRKAQPETWDIGLQMQNRIARSLLKDYSTDWSSKDSWGYLKDVPWHLVVEANLENHTVSELKTLVTIPAANTLEARGTLARQIDLGVQHWVSNLESDVRRADFRIKQWLATGSGE